MRPSRRRYQRPSAERPYSLRGRSLREYENVSTRSLIRLILCAIDGAAGRQFFGWCAAGQSRQNCGPREDQPLPCACCPSMAAATPVASLPLVSRYSDRSKG